MATDTTTQTYPGVYAAKVFSTADPLNQGRVQMLIPQIFGSTPVLIWAPSLIPNLPVPAVGAVVWAMFQGGEPSYPVYFPRG